MNNGSGRTGFGQFGAELGSVYVCRDIRQVVLDFYLGADFGTFHAANAGRGAVFAGNGAFLAVTAGDIDSFVIQAFGADFKKMARTDVDAGAAGSAFGPRLPVAGRFCGFRLKAPNLQTLTQSPRRRQPSGQPLCPLEIVLAIRQNWTPL